MSNINLSEWKFIDDNINSSLITDLGGFTVKVYAMGVDDAFPWVVYDSNDKLVRNGKSQSFHDALRKAYSVAQLVNTSPPQSCIPKHKWQKQDADDNLITFWLDYHGIKAAVSKRADGKACYSVNAEQREAHGCMPNLELAVAVAEMIAKRFYDEPHQGG